MVRKLTFVAHDYIEFIEKGQKYTVDTNYDKHTNPVQWNKDVEHLKKASWLGLQKRGVKKVEQTKKEKQEWKMTGEERILHTIKNNRFRF